MILINTVETGIQLLLNKARRHVESLSMGALAVDRENDRPHSNSSSTYNIPREPHDSYL